MRFAEYYSPDYVVARDRFLAAARDRGAVVASHRFQADGPHGEPLTMDVARLGPREPDRVVIISSALHGVEGFSGSATQLAWLATRGAGAAPPSGTALVLVHALNPFGFAWRRRWNENNVDLNRNFLVDRGFLAADPEYQASRATYERLHSLLNPASPPARCEWLLIKAFLRVLAEGYAARRRMGEDAAPPRCAVHAIWRLGLSELNRSLPVGQYEHPTGLFYGGDGPEETVRVVRESLGHWVANARDAIHVDLHTGLGKFGDYRLFIGDAPGSPDEQWAAGVFGREAVEAWNVRNTYAARGLMFQDLRNRLTSCRYRCLTAEFGTYSGVRVVRALRAENRAHFHGAPGTRSFERAKRQVMETFCPADARWRERAVAKGCAIIDQALAAEGDLR